MAYTPEEIALAKAIHASLNEGEGSIVHTYNDFFSDDGTIGIDGDVDLYAMARLILKNSNVK